MPSNDFRVGYLEKVAVLGGQDELRGAMSSWAKDCVRTMPSSGGAWAKSVRAVESLLTPPISDLAWTAWKGCRYAARSKEPAAKLAIMLPAMKVALVEDKQGWARGVEFVAREAGARAESEALDVLRMFCVDPPQELAMLRAAVEAASEHPDFQDGIRLRMDAIQERLDLGSEIPCPAAAPAAMARRL